MVRWLALLPLKRFLSPWSLHVLHMPVRGLFQVFQLPPTAQIHVNWEQVVNVSVCACCTSLHVGHVKEATLQPCSTIDNGL